MMQFYDKLPDMECLSGDTLRTFIISPKSGSFSGCSMQLIVARQNSKLSAIICKKCTPESGVFKVQLTSEDTSKLTEGMHVIHFRLIDSSGLSHRKLVGQLYVHQAAKGEDI